MTHTYEKTIGKELKIVVEYVLSSVSNEIKVVEMWKHYTDELGETTVKEHQMTWMSPESREALLMELDEDMTDRACKTGKFSMDAYCEEHPDFDNAMNGVK
jgi:hypothetical protein